MTQNTFLFYDFKSFIPFNIQYFYPQHGILTLLRAQTNTSHFQPIFFFSSLFNLKWLFYGFSFISHLLLSNSYHPKDQIIFIFLWIFYFFLLTIYKMIRKIKKRYLRFERKFNDHQQSFPRKTQYYSANFPLFYLTQQFSQISYIFFDNILMLPRKLLVCLAFIAFASALHLNLNHQSSLTSGRVTLKSDNGQYLKRCHECGGAYSDSASVNGQDSNDPLAIWTVQLVGDKVAFKADSGNYLSRCNNCWQKQQDSVFLHVPSLQGAPWSLWTPEELSDGRWAFKGDNGKYLMRCSSCTEGKGTNQFAFVEGTSSADSKAQWQVQYLQISFFPKEKILLASGSFGNYLKRCTDCKRGQKREYPVVFQANGFQKTAVWTPQIYGGKLALKADNGQYLARCEHCWENERYPNSAFVYVDDPRNEPKALWSVQYFQYQNTWAFKADNGKYLMACNFCAQKDQSFGAPNYGKYAFIQFEDKGSFLSHFYVMPAKMYHNDL